MTKKLREKAVMTAAVCASYNRYCNPYAISVYLHWVDRENPVIAFLINNAFNLAADRLGIKSAETIEDVQTIYGEVECMLREGWEP